MIRPRPIIFAIALLAAQWCHGQTAPHWLDSLDAAYLQSQSDHQKILVYAGQDSILPCRQQWQTLSSPQLADALSGLTLVHLDPEKSPATIRSLGIMTLPALRLINTDGKIISSLDGQKSTTYLLVWLSKQPNSEEPTDALQQLGSPDTAVRESAIRQIHADPTMAAKIVELLTASSLQQRLSAVDLLDQWGAPVAHIDPWNPITATDLTSLRKWAATSIKPSATTAPIVADELDALIAAPTEIDARAVRERLIRYGETILPQVAARLSSHPDDPARQRLVALRYRLVAADRLATAWPGGFDRLASADSTIRRSAVTELGSIANADDHRLLRELFTDNDSFVREQSLKLLRSVGGAETGKALVELLSDPESNVRAAVLKTLADSPDESLADDLVRYVQQEKDTDLLVHAVHVLQATPGDKTLDCMLGLLNNPQWRVRGEVAEGLLARLSPRDGTPPSADQTAKIHAALLMCLHDPDGYVVAKAAFTLFKSDFNGSAAALMDAAQQRPELATDVLKNLASEPTIAATMTSQILAMTSNPSPSVRAAAIDALAAAAPLTSGDTLQKALHDPDPTVNAAAARALVLVLQQLRPVNGQVTRTSFFGFVQTQVTVDMNQWVDDFRAGKDRPTWLNNVIPDLEKQLTQTDAKVSAAVALCAMGKEQAAWPVLTAPGVAADEAAGALEWLPWEKRDELFAKLTASNPAATSEILDHLVAIPDPRAADLVWNMLVSNDAAAVGRLATVHDALRTLYFGEQYYNAPSLPDDRKKAAIDATTQKAASGSDLQKTTALSLLLLVSPPDAATAAKRVYENSAAGEWPRLDALQILLTAQPSDDATQTAVAALNDKPMIKVALPFLAGGAIAIQQLHGEIELFSPTQFQSYATGQPITVTPPAGLTKEIATTANKQAIADHSDDLTADAAYLLATLGDRSGLDTLLRTARGHDWEDPWGRMAYRAITKINDDSMAPTLEEIYRRYAQTNQYLIREMYWTISTMTGPNVAKLRKKILDEIGMPALQ
jgi:HEAT repeat protein